MPSERGAASKPRVPGALTLDEICGHTHPVVLPLAGRLEVQGDLEDIEHRQRDQQRVDRTRRSLDGDTPAGWAQGRPRSAPWPSCEDRPSPRSTPRTHRRRGGSPGTARTDRARARRAGRWSSARCSRGKRSRSRCCQRPGLRPRVPTFSWRQTTSCTRPPLSIASSRRPRGIPAPAPYLAKGSRRTRRRRFATPPRLAAGPRTRT